MITCTITPPPDCLARLAACPALPRGERLEWAQGLDRPHSHAFYTARAMAQANQVAAPTRAGMVARWRSMARPLRDTRQKLREARTHISFLEGVCAEQKKRIQALVRGEL